MAQIGKRILKNTMWLYAKMALTMFVSLYSTRLILIGLGASDFGIFNVVGGSIALLAFLNIAMACSTQRFMSFYEGKNEQDVIKSVFNISIVLHFFIAIVVGLLLVLLGFILFNGVLSIPQNRVNAAIIIYGSLILSTCFTITSVPYDAVLNAHENMKYYAFVGILESLLKLFAAYFCTKTDFDKLAVYGIMMAIIPLISLTIMRIYCHRNYSECKLNPKVYWDATMFKNMAHYALWNLMTSIASILSQHGFGIVLNHFYGVVLNAAQGIANQISGQLMAFSNSMLKAVNPVITKSEGAGSRDKAHFFAFEGSKISFFLLAFFAIPIMIEMPYILDVWIKNVPEWAVMFCRLQLSRSIIEQLTICISSIIQAEGNIGLYSRCKSVLNFMPILLTTIAFAIGMPPYWMYIFWILFWSIFGGTLLLYFAHKNCNMSYTLYFKRVVIPCISVFSVTMLLTLLVSNTLEASFQRLCIVVASSTILFFLSVYFIGLNSQERELIISLKDKILKNR